MLHLIKYNDLKKNRNLNDFLATCFSSDTRHFFLFAFGNLNDADFDQYRWLW